MSIIDQEQALIELLELSRQLVSLDTINAGDVLKRIAESARKVLRADLIVLYTYDQSANRFEQPFFVGDMLHPEAFEITNSVRRSFESSKFAMREMIKSFAGIPLRFGNKPVGVMFVDYRTPQVFAKEERELIELFANQAAIAVNVVRMSQKTNDESSAKSTHRKTQRKNYYSCFISHSSRDEDFARKLYTDLRAKDVTCWFAPVDMKIGDRIRSKIDETINEYEALLLILSKSSIRSQWVEQEVEAALEKERKKKDRVLIPIRLDEMVMKTKSGWARYIRNTRNIGDFSSWQDPKTYSETLKRLVRDLIKKE